MNIETRATPQVTYCPYNVENVELFIQHAYNAQESPANFDFAFGLKCTHNNVVIFEFFNSINIKNPHNTQLHDMDLIDPLYNFVIDMYGMVLKLLDEYYNYSPHLIYPPRESVSHFLQHNRLHCN